MEAEAKEKVLCVCNGCDREITEKVWGGMRRLAFVGYRPALTTCSSVVEIRECVCLEPIGRARELEMARS